jgi:hypothetical protein
MSSPNVLKNAGTAQVFGEKISLAAGPKAVKSPFQTFA